MIVSVIYFTEFTLEKSRKEINNIHKLINHKNLFFLIKENDFEIQFDYRNNNKKIKQIIEIHTIFPFIAIIKEKYFISKTT